MIQVRMAITLPTQPTKPDGSPLDVPVLATASLLADAFRSYGIVVHELDIEDDTPTPERKRDVFDE